MSDFGERALDALREELRKTVSQKRFAHTLGVEQTVARMAEIYCKEKSGMLRAAALLHDCTKEYDEKRTKEVLCRYDRLFLYTLAHRKGDKAVGHTQIL